MSERYKVTDEDRSGKTNFDINSINNLIIQDEKLIFNKVSFDVLSGKINRPINIEFLKSGIEIDGRLVPNSSDVKIIEFDMCILHKINIERNSKVMDLKIKNSIVLDSFILKNKTFNELNLEHSKFYRKVKIQECTIKNGTSFFNTSFKELADFYRTKFNEVVFERADFEKISVFSEVKFYKDVDFKYVKFLGKSIFRDTVIKEKLNLRDTIFDDDANFLDITSEKRKKNKKEEIYGVPKIIKVANRETARIIKNFYDNSNNIIEANKFYALEMKERKKELNLENPFELFVFYLHSISSEHSQNWFLAFLWIILFGWFFSCANLDMSLWILVAPVMIFVILNLGLNYLPNNYQVISNTVRFIFLITLIFIFAEFTNQVCSIYNNDFTNQLIYNFTLFAGIGAYMTFGMLFYKLITAYLIYQLIVSVRQNTRRK